MPDDASLFPRQPGTPQPSFKFRVSLGAHGDLFFQHVSGLHRPDRFLETRGEHAAPLPGRDGVVTVSMRHGVVLDGGAWASWLEHFKNDPARRAEIGVELRDEAGKPATVWTLVHARPAGFVPTPASAASREIAIESIDFTCEAIALRRV